MSKSDDIKRTFDVILNTDTELVTKKTSNNVNKNKFIQIIKDIGLIYSRSNALTHDFSIDLSEYEAPVYRTIDNMLELLYGKNGKILIQHYLFGISEGIDRLVDQKGNTIIIKDVDDLWQIINSVLKIKSK